MRWRVFPNHSGGENITAVRGDGAEVTVASLLHGGAQQQLDVLKRKYGSEGERFPWTELMAAGMVRHAPTGEVQMAKKQKKVSKSRKAAKAERAKSKKENRALDKPVANGNGNGGSALAKRLTTLAKQAGKLEGASEVAKLAKKLSNGSTSHKDLEALRDAIKATAAAAREAEKDSLASELSAQNRHVRRLERAARK